MNGELKSTDRDRGRDTDHTDAHGGSRSSSTTPLSASEIREIRYILESRNKHRWLMTTLKFWLGYLSGALVGLYVVWDYMEKIIKKIVQ